MSTAPSDPDGGEPADATRPATVITIDGYVDDSEVSASDGLVQHVYSTGSVTASLNLTPEDAEDLAAELEAAAVDAREGPAVGCPDCGDTLPSEDHLVDHRTDEHDAYSEGSQ